MSELMNVIKNGAAPYTGGMKSSVDLMTSLVSHAVPFSGWGKVHFIDLTCNTAATACMFAAGGAKVFASDVAARSTIAAKSLLSPVPLNMNTILKVTEKSKVYSGADAYFRNDATADIGSPVLMGMVDALFFAGQQFTLDETEADHLRYLALYLYISGHRNPQASKRDLYNQLTEIAHRVEYLRSACGSFGHEVTRGDCSIVVQSIAIDPDRQVVASVNPPTNGMAAFDAYHARVDRLAERGPYGVFPELNPADPDEDTVGFWTRLVTAQLGALPSGSLVMNLSDSGDISWGYCQDVFGRYGEVVSTVMCPNDTKLSLWRL